MKPIPTPRYTNRFSTSNSSLKNSNGQNIFTPHASVGRLRNTGHAGFHTVGVFRLGTPLNGTIFIVLYSQDQEATMGKIDGEGGAISKGIFNFPGGRRFHFRDLDGYELAVWSE